MDGKTLFPQCRRAGPVYDTACGVCRPIGPIGAKGKDQHILKTFNTGSRRQGKFLIAPAKAISRQMHHRFTAGQNGEGMVGFRVGAGDGSEKAAGFPGLTAQPVCQGHRCISKVPAAVGGGGA